MKSIVIIILLVIIGLLLWVISYTVKNSNGSMFWKTVISNSGKDPQSSVVLQPSNVDLNALFTDKYWTKAILLPAQIKDIVKSEADLKLLIDNQFSLPEMNIFCYKSDQTQFIQKIYKIMFIDKNLENFPANKIINKEQVLAYLNGDVANMGKLLKLLNDKNTVFTQAIQKDDLVTLRKIFIDELASVVDISKKTSQSSLDIMIMLIAKKNNIPPAKLDNLLNWCWNFSSWDLSVEKLKNALTNR